MTTQPAPEIGSVYAVYVRYPNQTRARPLGVDGDLVTKARYVRQWHIDSPADAADLTEYAANKRRALNRFYTFDDTEPVFVEIRRFRGKWGRK